MKRSARTVFVTSIAFACALAFQIAPAVAAPILPLTIGGVTFLGFRDFTGSIDASCNNAFFALGSVTCTGPVFYANGPLGPGFHITGNATGTGTTIGGASPTVEAQLDLTGGDVSSGAFGNDVTTNLSYFVTILSLGQPPSPATKIPLTFTDAGSFNGTAPGIFSIDGLAQTFVSAFLGTLVVDGAGHVVNDQVTQGANGGAISGSYNKSHSVVFDFSGGDTVAEVDLTAECTIGALQAGFGTSNCIANADPFIGFDQATFDTLMGPDTFLLSDFFKIEISAGLDGGGQGGPTGVPEPGTLALFGAGLAGLSTLGRRKTRA